jgi:hypothetical protein
MWTPRVGDIVRTSSTTPNRDYADLTGIVTVVTSATINITVIKRDGSIHRNTGYSPQYITELESDPDRLLQIAVIPNAGQ